MSSQFILALLWALLALSYGQLIPANSSADNALSSLDPSATTIVKKSATGFIDYLEQGNARNIAKDEKRKARVSTTLSYMRQMFQGWIPAAFSANHTKSQEVIFTTAISQTYGCSTARLFAGTARAVGFTGDIVVAVVPNAKAHFLECLKELNVIVYIADMHCEGHDVHQICSMPAIRNVVAPVSFFRYYFYSYWAASYSVNTVIMLADFRDSFFQSNPFQYKADEWYPPLSELVVFEENFPLKVINRDLFMQTYIRNCYDENVLDLIGSNTIITSGIAIGSRDGVVSYVTTILQQNDPFTRHRHNTSYVYDPNNDKCSSPGMDQGFHNWIIHSGMLARTVALKKYSQGEGPVNSIGAFGGHKAIIKRSLVDWEILQGEGVKKRIVNWNGDLSPMVHQADRLLATDFSPRLEAHFELIAKAQQSSIPTGTISITPPLPIPPAPTQRLRVR